MEYLNQDTQPTLEYYNLTKRDYDRVTRWLKPRYTLENPPLNPFILPNNIIETWFRLYLAPFFLLAVLIAPLVSVFVIEIFSEPYSNVVGLVVVIVPLVFILFAIAVRTILDPMVRRKAIVVRVAKYQQALICYEHMNKGAAEDKKRAAEHKRKEEETKLLAQQQKDELKRLKTGWERHIYKELPHTQLKNDNGTLRIKGKYLLAMLNFRDFEILIAFVLQNQGWKVQITNRGADGGVDVVGEKYLDSGTKKLYAQAKHYYKSGTKVGRPVLQALIGTSVMEKATDSILVCSSGFTQQALSYAKEHQVDGLKHSLWGPIEIQRFIDELPLTSYENVIEPIRKRWELTRNKSNKN